MLDMIKKNIERRGQHMFGVFPVDAGDETFCYTIGNHSVGLPELISIGPFPSDLIGVMLNTIGDMQRKNGKPFEEGLLDIDWTYPVKLRKCSDNVKDHYTIQATNFYGTADYDVMQVMICDKQGKFPDDEGVSPPFNVPMP